MRLNTLNIFKSALGVGKWRPNDCNIIVGSRFVLVCSYFLFWVNLRYCMYQQSDSFHYLHLLLWTFPFILHWTYSHWTLTSCQRHWAARPGKLSSLRHVPLLVGIPCPGHRSWCSRLRHWVCLLSDSQNLCCRRKVPKE